MGFRFERIDHEAIRFSKAVTDKTMTLGGAVEECQGRSDISAERAIINLNQLT